MTGLSSSLGCTGPRFVPTPDSSPVILFLVKESPRTVTVEGTELDTVKYWHQLYQENMTKFFDILEKLSPGIKK